jgi:uncharacterized YccA/Bax inhibitor family protein
MAKSGILSANPIVRKLQNVKEHDDQNCCTYAGISRKLIIFTAMVVAGVLMNLLLKFTGSTVTIEGITVTKGQMAFLALAGVIMLICPFISIFFVGAIPVTGSLFCMATGYVLSWAGGTFGGEYAATIRLALILTAAIVLTMSYLYRSGIVRNGNKVRTVVFTLVFSMVIGGILVFIGALIPATRNFVGQLMTNPLLNIGISAVYVVIGALFLIVDFETIDRVVADELPKKYEWLAAYSLAFSIIWLYLKVLEMLLRLRGSSDKD